MGSGTGSSGAAVERLVDRFVDACRVHHDLDAVDDGTRVLTYGELLDQVQRVAAAVAARTPPAAVVGVIAAKTVWSVAAIFGTLLADRTALLLDPDEPPAWWADRTARVDARVLLADDGIVVPAAVVDLPRLGPAECAAASPAATAPAGPTDVDPYILCTSGSTGEPKLVWQVNALALDSWESHRARFAPFAVRGRRVVVIPPLAFAASRVALYGALSGGGCLVLVDTVRTPPGAVVDLVADRAGPVLFAPIAMLRALMVVIDAREAPVTDIEVVHTSGGMVDQGDLVTCRRCFPNARILVDYGSTELGTISTFVIEPDADPAVPTAGDLRPGVRVRVLDVDGDELPAGTVGDLWMASTHPMGAFRDDPALEAATRRVDADGTVWNRTGDLGCVRPDGRLEIHGRDDDRVKVNGAPVDLNVVAAAVGALDGVVDAAVSAVPAEGDTRLVAWVVMERGRRPTVRDLRAELEGALPRPMQPHVFRALGEIPRTHRGKVDRVALREAAAKEVPVGVAHVAPRTPVEEDLAARVRALLFLDDVGVHETLFELGGDSLDALELVGGIVEDLGLEADTQAALEVVLVTDGSIAALAAVLEHPAPAAPGAAEVRPDGVVRLELRADGGTDDAVVVLVPGGGQTPVALRPLVARLDGRSVWTLLPPGFRAGSQPDPSIETLAARYADAVLAAGSDRDLVVAGFSFGALVAYALARELTARGAPVRSVALLDTDCPRGAAAGGAPHRAPWWRRVAAAARARWRRARRGAGPPAPRPGVDDVLPSESMLWASALVVGYDPPPTDLAALVVRCDAAAAAGVAPDRGWSRLCRGPLDTLDVPGTHLDVLREPAVGVIGAALLAASGGPRGGRPPVT